VMVPNDPVTGLALGPRLRKAREDKGQGLREVATKAGVNHGYLSQLERGEVAQPAPSVLQKLARGYDEPFIVLMRWAGYIEDGSLSPNHERALKYMGDDFNDQELAAIKAVLDAIRKGRAEFSGFDGLDGDLSRANVVEIRKHVMALLQKADVLDKVPTPIDPVMDVARLVAAGEVTLDAEERRRLRAHFGYLVDIVLNRLQGVIHFRSREIWINPEMYPLRRRFVLSHEIGHDVLPWHRELFAYLDDATRLRPDVRDLYERQANQAGIELLAQGDLLTREADDSALTMDLVTTLSCRYSISIQATARRIVEESKQECALVMAFRGSVTGALMPHLYSSEAFEKRFAWKATRRASQIIENTLAATQRGEQLDPLVVLDAGGRVATLDLDYVNMSRAVLVTIRAAATSRSRVSRLLSIPERGVAV
jgi:transcriptional regulator with XRE-family HTH domain